MESVRGGRSNFFKKFDLPPLKVLYLLIIMSTTNSKIKTQWQAKPILLVCGLSGAGRSTALQVFEDLNYLCTDGIPPSLINEFASLMQKSEMLTFKGLALGIDVAKQQKDVLLQDITPILNTLQKQGQYCSIIFLDASDEIILKRYATTRRPHPLEKEGLTLENAIEKERKKLLPLKSLAQIVIDTSRFSLHDFRRFLQRHFDTYCENSSTMHINLISFGYKYGMPREADLVYDMRFLPNPYFIDELKPKSGLDVSVVNFIFNEPTHKDYKDKFLEHIKFSLPYYENEGRYRLCIAIGCTGGQHRSVAMTEILNKALTQAGYAVTLEHRHIKLN